MKVTDSRRRRTWSANTRRSSNFWTGRLALQTNRTGPIQKSIREIESLFSYCSDTRTKLLWPIWSIHCRAALQTKSNKAPLKETMEAARPAVWNWSIMVEVVSLLLTVNNILVQSGVRVAVRARGL